VDVDAKAAPDAGITETIAAGYSFQGRLLRPALVRLIEQSHSPKAKVSKPEPDNSQSQLPLEAAATT
jgi:hypothetical protein